MPNIHAIQWNRSLAGALLMIPAVLFVTANLLKYQVGLTQPYDVLSPAWSTDVAAYQAAFNSVVLLGPLVGLALVAWSVIRLSFGRRGGGWVASLSVEKRWPQLAVLGARVSLLGVMGLYLIAENLPCILGRQVLC
jgi:hypothetical protein